MKNKLSYIILLYEEEEGARVGRKEEGEGRERRESQA
jgi:hypothetical protein